MITSEGESLGPYQKESACDNIERECLGLCQKESALDNIRKRVLGTMPESA